MTNELWEILVPTTRRLSNGTVVPCSTRYHRVWDAVIRDITGGLTILKPAKGYWVDDGEIYTDRTIPVRIACTREQIEKIIDITLSYYNQVAVMAYKISDEVIVKRFIEIL
jgi:hypothetical protein